MAPHAQVARDLYEVMFRREIIFVMGSYDVYVHLWLVCLFNLMWGFMQKHKNA